MTVSVSSSDSGSSSLDLGSSSSWLRDLDSWFVIQILRLCLGGPVFEGQSCNLTLI